jgi:hypothetical protein
LRDLVERLLAGAAVVTLCVLVGLLLQATA